jgi:ABC-2 type transport system ATP-binding protein
MIEVLNLTKRYGKFSAVDRISFFVPKGKVFGFLGPNGAGKTTTIKMLTTMLSPTEGKVRVDGLDPVRDQDSVRRTFGIVFQDPSLDEALTAFENMELHAVLYRVDARARRRRIEQLLRFVELWDRQGEFVKRFSGGMKRRLEIARALLHEPKIMFLDEPTLGLDPQTRNHIWSYLKKLSKERDVTVFFTTHYMEEADRVADEIAVIDHGRIVAQGSPTTLKEKAQADSLEDAFIALTGHAIRDEEASTAIICGGYKGFWGEDERHLHSLATAVEAVFPCQNPDRFSFRATRAIPVFVGLWF